MSALLDEILEAHGGLEHWSAVSSITARFTFAGLLRARFPGNRMAGTTVRVDPVRQHAVLLSFPRKGQRAVFDEAEVRIETADGEVLETRREARAAFRGPSGLRRNFRWDPLDATYFAGYAMWNYLTTPFLLKREGVTVREGDPWHERSERWQRLEVAFPPELHTHCPRQVFYVDRDGLIRRHDYVAEPIGRWARAAHYCDEHRVFDGLVFPTRRRVRPLGPAGRSLPGPTLVALDIERVDIDT